jgi:hypothetical protein
MTQDVYYQFPQTPEQLRRCGARGGKATARLWRVRRDDGVAAERLQPESEPEVPRETTAAAIARLDDQYPWLRGAEKRSCKQFRQ